MDKLIYLDYNATTPVDPEVIRVMEPFLHEHFGNPSSVHAFGARTRQAIENARMEVAELIGAKPWEIVFTSGGTESNNLAIQGAARARKHLGRHIITTAIEHPAVLEVCRFLEEEGFVVTRLPVDRFGMVDPGDLESALQPGTILVSVMHANNEVGTIQPLAALSEIVRNRGILFHTDAAQSAGKIPVQVDELGADLLSLAGHKLYAPKGVGALYIRQGVSLSKILFGADHEQNRRPGTENVLEIVGLGEACRQARIRTDRQEKDTAQLRNLLQELILEAIPEAVVNGHPEKRLPNTLSVSFPALEAQTLLGALEDVAASAGAACHADEVSISGVLHAMGLPEELAMGTIRLSCGRFSTEDEIREAADRIIRAHRSLKPGALADYVRHDKIRLTQFTHGLGCACKLRPQDLEQVIRDLPVIDHPDVLVGPQNSDDAAVYRMRDDLAIVETVDFFTPVVDDPYWFGAIAAANALSDIYAMGAKPLFGLNIVGFPVKRLSLDVLRQILQGAHDKAAEAGIPVLGGHTIEDTEPKYGMVVTGSVDPAHLWTNSGALAGDVLILTKPLGTGVFSTALKRGLLESSEQKLLYETMATLNKEAAQVLSHFSVHACTDVTGFGFIGHLLEMTKGSKMNAEILTGEVPLLPGLFHLIGAGVIPGGTLNNRAFTAPMVQGQPLANELMTIALNDAQTSGGLLAALPAHQGESALEALRQAGIQHASMVGHITVPGKGSVTLI